MADYKTTIDFNDRPLVEGLERAIQAADRLDRKIDLIQDSLNKTGRNTGGADNFTKSLNSKVVAADNATKAAARFGRAAGLSFAAFNIGAGIVQGAANSLAGLGNTMVGLGAQTETARANFTTFLGSVEKADEALKSLNDFAAATPFTQNQIIDGGGQLLAFRVEQEKLVPVMQQLGDLSKGNGEVFKDLIRIYGQAKTATTVYNEDLLQLTERGIPIYETLAEVLKRPVGEIKKLSAEGQITFPLLEQAFQKLTTEGGLFAGLMERQSKTFAGLYSTLQGDAEQLAASIGSLLIPSLKEAIIEADNLIKSIDAKAIGAALAEFGDAAEPFINTIKEGVARDIIPALDRYKSELSGVIDLVQDFTSDLNKNGDVSRLLKNALELVTGAFARLADVINFSISAVVDFSRPIIEALTPAVSSTINLINGLIEKFNELDSTTKNTGSAFTVLGKAVGVIVEIAGIAIELVNEVVAAVLNLGDSARSADPLIRAFGDAINFITAPLREFWAFTVRATNATLEFLGVTESAAQRNARAFVDQAKAAEDAARQTITESSELATYYKNREDADNKAAQNEQKNNAARLAGKKKTQEQLTKDAEKAERERQRLILELMRDETERAIAEEKFRYAEQVKEIKTYFKNKAEQQKRLEDAAAIHAENLTKIQAEANDKLQQELNKTLARERGFIADREQLFLDMAKNAAENNKNIADIQAQIAESVAAGYIQRLKASGAGEEEIALKQQQFDLAIKKVRIENELAFQEALLKATSVGDTARIEQIQKNIELLKSDLSNVKFEIEGSAIPDNFVTATLKDLKNVRASIADALGIKVDELGPLANSAKSAIGGLADALAAITEVQIEENDRLIDSINERIDKQKDLVEKERDAKQRGLANSLDAQQKELDGLLKQREDAEKRATELQERTVRQQLIQDSLAQISGTATSVVNILKDTTKIPFVGVALAAIQIASLFALLASSRAKAKAATRLKDGGLIPWGRTDEDGKIGYQIEDTGIMVGGNEFVMRRKSTVPNIRFLHRMNKGEFDQIDLNELVNRSVLYRPNYDISYKKSSVFQHDMTEQMQEKGIRLTADKMDKIINDAVERQTNALLRNGFSRLMALGQRMYDQNGNLVHFSIDAAGNEYKRTEINGTPE